MMAQNMNVSVSERRIWLSEWKKDMARGSGIVWIRERYYQKVYWWISVIRWDGIGIEEIRNCSVSSQISVAVLGIRDIIKDGLCPNLVDKGEG